MLLLSCPAWASCQQCWCVVGFILIMLACGVLGGYVNYFSTRDDLSTKTDADGKTIPEDPKIIRLKEKRYLGKCTILGMGASMLVPLFLYFVNKDLISCDKMDGSKYLFFISLCVLAAIASQRFISTLADKVLQLAKDAKTTAADAQSKANDASQKAKENEDKANVMQQALSKTQATTIQLNAENKQLKASAMKPSTATEFTLQAMDTPAMARKVNIDRSNTAFSDFSKVVEEKFSQVNKQIKEQYPDELDYARYMYEDDPYKSRFGKGPEANGRKMSGMAEPIDGSKYCQFSITVESTDPAKPLEDGAVLAFIMHPTFPKQINYVAALGGKAVFTDTSYGAFTVIAILDNGDTTLELDMAASSFNAPDAWKKE